MSMEFDRTKFSEYIKKKFFEWRGKTEKNWSDFALYVNVSQQTMNSWKQGNLKKVPDHENLDKLVRIFGEEVYHAVNIPRPLDQLPPELRSMLESALLEIGKSYESAGVSPDSPEGLALASAILNKHGFLIKAIDNKVAG